MQRAQSSLEAPSYPELWCILLTGLLHVVVELVWNQARGATIWLLTPDQLYNFSAIGLWGVYGVWRLATTPGLARVWGFRKDNFIAALRPSLVFALCAGVLLMSYGSLAERSVVPKTFWLALAVYPLYGIAQQFALQVLVAKNLRTLVPTPLGRAGVTGAVFGLAHFPLVPLMLLTAPAGVVFTRIFESRPNLWAVGLAHGLLGAVAYYVVLGLDPGAQILEILTHPAPF